MIRTEGLSVAYGATVAVRDVSLTVQAGRILAIVGPSGCGKSTFLSALNRMTDLIPHAVVTGRVLVNGKDVHSRESPLTELRRRVGMIFQSPNPFPTSIRKNIQLALKEHGMRRAAALEAKTEAVLRDVGLWDEVQDRLDSSALTLSGGQQQRLCIARALALQPEVLLMDEPCSALDPIAAGHVEALISSLRGRYTVVIVTHNLAQARRIADDMAVFWLRDGAGQMIEYGPAERLFTQPRDPISAAYLNGSRG